MAKIEKKVKFQRLIYRTGQGTADLGAYLDEIRLFFDLLNKNSPKVLLLVEVYYFSKFLTVFKCLAYQ